MANVYVDAIAGNAWRRFGYDSHITYFFDDAGARPWSAAEKTGFTAALQSWANVAKKTAHKRRKLTVNT